MLARLVDVLSCADDAFETRVTPELFSCQMGAYRGGEPGGIEMNSRGGFPRFPGLWKDTGGRVIVGMSGRDEIVGVGGYNWIDLRQGDWLLSVGFFLNEWIVHWSCYWRGRDVFRVEMLFYLFYFRQLQLWNHFHDNSFIVSWIKFWMDDFKLDGEWYNFKSSWSFMESS